MIRRLRWWFFCLTNPVCRRHREVKSLEPSGWDNEWICLSCQAEDKLRPHQYREQLEKRLKRIQP